MIINFSIRFLAIFLLLSITTGYASADWCAMWRDTNKTSYCVKLRADCIDTKSVYCIENNKGVANDAINSFQRPQPYESDVQYCAFWRDTNKLNYCVNNPGDCQSTNSSYCKPVKIR